MLIYYFSISIELAILRFYGEYQPVYKLTPKTYKNQNCSLTSLAKQDIEFGF